MLGKEPKVCLVGLKEWSSLNFSLLKEESA